MVNPIFSWGRRRPLGSEWNNEWKTMFRQRFISFKNRGGQFPQFPNYFQTICVWWLNMIMFSYWLNDFFNGWIWSCSHIDSTCFSWLNMIMCSSYFVHLNWHRLGFSSLELVLHWDLKNFDPWKWSGVMTWSLLATKVCVAWINRNGAHKLRNFIVKESTFSTIWNQWDMAIHLKATHGFFVGHVLPWPICSMYSIFTYKTGWFMG